MCVKDRIIGGKWKSIRGETLAETTIALVILSIGIVFSGTIMAGSLRNITSAKERVIAVNIAREGIESMRNIRDTNWLKFSTNRRTCFNHLPGTEPDTCDGSSVIGIGDYVVYKDENKRWRLSLYQSDESPDKSQLYLVDIDTTRDTSGDKNTVNDQDMYNHLIANPGIAVGKGDDPIGYLHATITPFKRVIHVDYMTNAGALVSESGIPLDTNHNRIVITSTVSWIENGREHFAILKTHLTDYLGREKLEG